MKHDMKLSINKKTWEIKLLKNQTLIDSKLEYKLKNNTVDDKKRNWQNQTFHARKNMNYCKVVSHVTKFGTI